MPCRAWQFVAALGLALALASSGQAQEEAPGGQGEPPAQEQPAPTLPIPLPVDIVEDEADAEARERSEREARQREIDALIAQQGMNDATRAMNDATQRMAKYALYSTLLVGVGTVLLIGTLWLTRQANRAAQTGVTVTEAAYKMDQRPWLAIGNPTVAATRVGPLHLGSNVEALWLHYDLTVTNTGKTPAQDARLLTLVGRRNTEEWNTEVKAMDAILPKPAQSGSPLPPARHARCRSLHAFRSPQAKCLTRKAR